MKRQKKTAVMCSDAEHEGPPRQAIAHGKCPTCYARHRRREQGAKPLELDPPGSVEIKIRVSGEQAKRLAQLAEEIGTSVRRLGGELVEQVALNSPFIRQAIKGALS